MTKLKIYENLLEELFHYFEDDIDLPHCDYFLDKIINILEGD